VDRLSPPMVFVQIGNMIFELYNTSQGDRRYQGIVEDITGFCSASRRIKLLFGAVAVLLEVPQH